MSEEKAPARPRQVSMAVVMAVVSSLVLVLGLFETLERLRTPATREAVDDFLAGAPGSSLGLETAQVVDLMRALAFVAGALAATGLVFAVFVWQRHRGARIGLTVVAVLLLLTFPVAGLMPVFLAVAAFLLWSQPARDWYAGREPAPVPAPAPPQLGTEREQRPEAAGQSQSQTPPPYPQPYGQPTQPDQLSQPSQPSQPSPADQPSQPSQPNPWSDANQPNQWGQPYQPQGFAAQQHASPDKRPTSVTVAALLTWIGAGLTSLAMLAFLVVLSVNGDAFVDEFDRAAQQSELTLSRDQVWAFGLAIGLTMLVWSLVSIVLAFFAFRRSNGARYALAISAVMAALFSLLSILSLVSALTLLLAVATVVLLFTGSASRWFAGRSGPAGQPPYQPPYQPPHQPPYQPPYPPADPPGRNQPW